MLSPPASGLLYRFHEGACGSPGMEPGTEQVHKECAPTATFWSSSAILNIFPSGPSGFSGVLRKHNVLYSPIQLLPRPWVPPEPHPLVSSGCLQNLLCVIIFIHFNSPSLIHLEKVLQLHYPCSKTVQTPQCFCFSTNIQCGLQPLGPF